MLTLHGVRLPSIALLAVLALGCERKPQAHDSADAAQVELDAGALRASAVDGLEAASEDPVIGSKLGLASALEHPRMQEPIERMLARAGADPGLSDAGDRFFVELQDSEAMRATLADYARSNPELDLAALTEGFVGYVDERLTRPAVAKAIEDALRTELRLADPAFARALIIEAKGAELLGSAIVASFANADTRAELERRLGRDPAALQQRLERRLADPSRVGYLVAGLGQAARTKAGLASIIEIVDHQQTATLLAGALTRALDDAKVRARGEALFGLALAEEFDSRTFTRELRLLLDEPAIVRELAAVRDAIAREPFVRERVAKLVSAVAGAPEFAEGLIEALAGE